MGATFFKLPGRLMNQRKTSSKIKLSASKEKALIRLAQRGDFNAFEVLYDNYFDQVYNRVWYLIPKQDVEDVTQETFTAAVKSLKNFRGDSKLSTWLRTLTNRQIANYYRSRNRTDPAETMDIEDIDTVKPLNYSQKTDATNVDDMMMLREGLDTLPEHYREVILLRFADGMKFKDIARITDRSIEATKSLFRRAITTLRNQLGETHE